MSIILGGNEITGNDQFLLNNTSNNNGNLIVLTNESDDNDNLLINFNSNYDFGFNNNDIILSQHSNHDNYYLKINNSNILFNNINISNIFTSNYIVQDNSGNKIIEIDNNNTYFNNNNTYFNNNNTYFNNNVTFNIKEKNFTIKNDKIDIINVSNNILFNCNLYIDTIYCRNINPYDNNGFVDIDNFQITSAKTFSNIDLIYTNNDAKLTMISDINKDIYDILVINNNYDNSNIFSINNKGFINYREKSSNSFININNNSNESELYNIINYQGDFDTDKFSINKYSHINIGSNINLNNNNGALFTINRNDERKNLDETNSQNVNRDKSLLDLNIFYESSNNYEWFINSNVESTITDLFNNNIFTQDFDAGGGQIEMNVDEFKNLFDNYLNSHQSGSNAMYYLDIISSNNIRNYDTSNYYYFLATDEIKEEIDYDYTKLKLNDPVYNVSGNRSLIVNRRYNENNLLNNTNQVYYEYKVYSWSYETINSDDINYYIIYPAYLKNINNSNLKLNCNIENIQYTDNESAAKQLYFSISIDNDKNYNDTDLTNAIDIDNNQKNRLTIGINEFGQNINLEELNEYISSNTDSTTKKITINENLEIIEYCKDYANITLPTVFTIHISKEIYNYVKLSDYKILYNYYYPQVINKPNFINFTNNDNVITTINKNGSLQFGHYDNTTHTDININEYSIISPNNKILTSNIKTDIITSYNNNSVSFDNKNIININSLNFSGEGSNLLNIGNINVGNIIVKEIISSDSNINIYNSLFNYTINDNNLILSSNKFNNQHYNSIINIDSSYDTDIKPAISISGNDPSFIQKNSNYIYQTVIKNKKFRKDYDSNNTDTKTCYEINYSNLINKNFEYKDNTFNNFNSTHILQHIIDDDIISLGQNYNLCFYNGFFTSNSSNYSKLLSQNTSNSSFSMSLGVPYKNDNISDYDNGSYYYNYIDYFNNNIKNNNYMLNIFGNTKISGIDGDTNALNVVIQDKSNIDGIFFTNIGIGKEPRNETNKNILDVDGDIYTSNIYINDTNISNYLEINVPDIIRKTNINASKINDGIIDLQHIPDIPSLKLEPPGIQPFMYDPQIGSNYIHPQIGSNYINTLSNTHENTHENTRYFYNIFESSSNFQINNSIIADILLIGGGGSANNDKGGAGGDVILLNNVDIINNSIITFSIGEGGNTSTSNGSETTITIKNDDIQKNITYKAYGGEGGINQGDGNDINPNLAQNIYSHFSVYSSNFGMLSSGNKLYFGGNGNGNDNGNHSDYLLSLSRNKKGSGGYFSSNDNDINGINGAIFIRYRFEPTFIETHDTVYDTLGLLQYNWTSNSWSLNYDNFNHCNILLNKITDTSNILIDTINNTSNNVIEEIHRNSNLLIQETSNINNIIDYNSNYSYENISNLYHIINDDIFHKNSNYIIKNEKIPLLNINKLNHVNDYYLYNPIVNNEIVNTTSNYKMINSSNYIFLEHDNSDIAQVTYNIKFQNNDEVDILLVGGGGKGGEGGGSERHNGGGGGAIIEIKNLRVNTGDTFIINVGKGGGKNTGTSEKLFGQDTTLQYNGYTLTAKGGKGSDLNGLGGEFIIPPEFIDIYSYIEKHNYNGGNGGNVDGDTMGVNGFISDILGSNYYWGGGGGKGIWPIYDKNNDESFGGLGGGGGGAFYLSQGYTSTNFTSQGGKETYFNDTDSDIDNDVTTTNGNNDNGIINGAHGIDGTGGGGGGSIHISYSDITGTGGTGKGGNGGNGIAIIKFKNIYNNNVLVKKAYLYYNYDTTKWEVQSFNSLNLNINTQDINIQQIYYNINNISNYLIEYVDNIIIPVPGSNIPLASISGFNIADRSIGPENIFGYMGRASNITDDTDLDEDENGLITIPQEGYNDPENSYYKRLINGSKLQNNSITNDNLVDNTITREKINGKIHGSKLSNLSIDYNDIIDSINSEVFLTNNHDCNIYFSNFSNISLDLSYFNIDETHINDGYSINITNTTNVEIPINTFSNIRINYSDLNTSCNYDGILNLYSLNNDIDINRFSNVNINISNLDGYGQNDFIISNINLNGVIPQNYINKIYVNLDNLDSNSLDNANVYLLSDNGIIENNIITHFNITYDQLKGDNISNVTITINQDLINNSNIHDPFINIDNIDYEINKFSNVSVIFKEGSNINSSNIYNCFIDNYNINYENNLLSNVIINFDENETINATNIDKANINYDNIFFDDLNKLNNITIIFDQNININASNINSSTINSSNIYYDDNNKLSNVIINFDVNETIDASNIDKANINYDNIFFNDFNKLNNITIIFDQNININASNIISSTINSSNIDYDDNNKLSNVIIEGDINSWNITNAILKDTANIIGNTNFEVTVNGIINSSNISRATLKDSCTIVGTDKINNVFINCDIQSSNIGSNVILSRDSKIIGDEKISNITITGEINASNINNATINLNDNTTRFSSDSKIGGPVTITGIIYSSNFDFATYNNQISFDLITGDNTIDGKILTDESINSTKLASNLDLFVDSITFDDGNIITNLNDYYTSNQIDNKFVSKYYHIEALANNIISNSNININLYNKNDTTYSNYKAPFILNDNYIFIDSSSNIYTNEDYALLNIYDKNESANIYIYSKNNSLYEFDNIDRTSTDNGSMIKFNNPLLSINLQNSNVMEFNINSNISYNDFKLNGNIIFSDDTTIGSGSFNSLYNSVTKQLIMDNTRDNIDYNDFTNINTGEGFIHCNGLHAMFDITAFSTTNSSDKRLKKDIKELSYDNEILKLNPVSFKWNDKNKSNSSNVGFIAQEIEEILPILVKNGPDDYKTVNYTGLIPYLVKHIQNLEERIKILENN